MLILKREVGEEIVIKIGNEVVRVVVSSIRGDKVRIGFVAPAGMIIDRKEVYERRQAAKEQQP